LNRIIGKFLITTGVIFGISSLEVYAAPMKPEFKNPSPEYFFTNSGANIGFTVFPESAFNVTWTVQDITNPLSPKPLCSGVLPKLPIWIPIRPYKLSCPVPFVYGETQLQTRTCGGGINPCSTSNIKSVYQYNDSPSSAPRIGTWSPYYFIELFSEYKAGEEITFDMTFNAISQYQRPTTLNIWQVGTPDKLLCSTNVGVIEAVSHMAPGIGSCKAIPTTISAPSKNGEIVRVYAQTCNTGVQGCGPQSEVKSFKIVKNPWTTLDPSNWIARKNSGPMTQDFNPEGPRYDTPYENNNHKTIAAYYTEWGVYARRFYPKYIPVENLTHIYHSFISICGDHPVLAAMEKENVDNGDNYTKPHTVLENSCKAIATSMGHPIDTAGNWKNHVRDLVTIHDRDAAISQVGWIGPYKDEPPISGKNGKFDLTETSSDTVQGIFGEYYRMKMAFPHIKILPSIGGGTMSAPFFGIANDPARRKVFITSTINFINKYDFFDGVDLDWEFPASGDAQAFVDLTRELRLHLDDLGRKKNRSYELHVTFGGTPGFIENLLMAEMDALPYYLPNRTSIDHFNFMTYDYYGAWNNNFGHHAAIANIGGGTPNEGLSAIELINKAIAMGVPAHKINIGVAAYARGWDAISGGDTTGPFNSNTQGGEASLGYKPWVDSELDDAQLTGRWAPGFADYKGMERNEMGGPNGTGANGWQLLSDPVFDSHQYLWNLSTGSLMTLDTAKSTKAKGELVDQYGLGGVIIWSIDGDSGTLLNALHEGLGNTPK
jgi:chitinase